MTNEYKWFLAFLIYINLDKYWQFIVNSVGIYGPQRRKFHFGTQKKWSQSFRALFYNFYSSEKNRENLQQQALEAGRSVPTLTGLSRALYVSQLAAENR